MARPQRLKGWTTGGGRRMPALLCGIFLLIGLGMLGGATYLVIDTRRDLAVGVSADGMVIDLIRGGMGIVFTAVGGFAAKPGRRFRPSRTPVVIDSPAAPDDAPMVRTIERSARD